MSLCTQYSKLIVSGATNSPNANGEYFPFSVVNFNGITTTEWRKSEAQLFPKISWAGTLSTGFRWELQNNVPFQRAWYSDGPYNILTFDDLGCPRLGQWFTEEGFGGGTDPAPTVTGISATPSQNTFGLAADVVALITSRFGSVANFLRLRNQGQV
jgi:hypothetical protein